jgi:ATP-dependent Zn protease
MDEKKLKIARHETGHAVMAMICRHNVQVVSLKEMDTPPGIDKFLGFTKVEAVDKNATFTIKVADLKIMISLGGYASEILFYDVAGIGGEDLKHAVRIVEDMLQVEDFYKLVSELPEPHPEELRSIENPMVRRFIDYKFDQAVQALLPLKPVINTIAEELYKKEELSGHEFSELFDSLI